jgi:hypothetical protein
LTTRVPGARSAISCGCGPRLEPQRSERGEVQRVGDVDDEPIAELVVVGAQNIRDRVVGDGKHDDLARQRVADRPGAHLARQLVRDLAGLVGPRPQQSHPMATGEQPGPDATRHVAGAHDRDLHAAALARFDSVAAVYPVGGGRAAA